jgi:2-polyprenyl-3-methyl-5-hydroxy-6-metoxy-1,4-benzoquinol methylase
MAEDANFKGQTFDVVVLIHIIEHFFEPAAVLHKTRQLLRPGGLVFLETPNILRPKVVPGRVFSFAKVPT